MTATRAAEIQERYRARLAGAMTVSLLVHGLILSLQFGIPGIGLPTLELPWRERRTQATRLEVIIANAEKPPAGAQEEQANPPVSNETQPSTGLTVVPRREAPPPAPAAKTVPGRVKKTPPAVTRRAKKEEPVIALTEPRERSFSVPAPALDEIPSAPPEQPAASPQPAPPPEPAMQDDIPAVAEDTAQREREAAEAARAQEEAAERQRALALEAQRIEELQKREEAERLALELEARKRDEEAARLAVQKQREQEEAARRALELEEKRREEARRLQAERMQREAMELQARKQAEEAVARERERQAEELAARRKAEAEAANAARHDTELVPGDVPPSGNARSADALPRNLGGGLAGRALDQAKRPDLLRSDPPAAHRPEISTDSPRRHSVFGSAARDVGVMMYVESWRMKIERNGALNYKKSSAEKVGRDPVVTVAVRSDGSVEDVIIHQSSGRPEIDDAVHRIVRVNARFSAFPPELARRFDVIEIRRVWNFDDRLRILEEVR
ncbi:TonB family protein [Herbaspirillum sp. HC18]|nr:TonB family protein [Herbaspirillum sp. HC18]